MLDRPCAQGNDAEAAPDDIQSTANVRPIDERRSDWRQRAKRREGGHVNQGNGRLPEGKSKRQNFTVLGSNEEREKAFLRPEVLRYLHT